jgi:hypothetical protein
MLDLRIIVRALAQPWMRDATCATRDYARLDPIAGGEPTSADLDVRREAAEQLCAHCPVLRICAAEADLHGDVGVRGGSLRYRRNHDGGDRGEYTVEYLIPNAPASALDRRGAAERLARKRALVGGGAR